MLTETVGAARDFNRLHAIAGVLMRHGFGEAVQRSGIAALLHSVGHALHVSGEAPRTPHSQPERVRMAFEELGTTFIKLGQVLSTRVDLFGPEWIAQFEMLQDQAKPLEFEALRPQLREDLGDEPERVFRFVDPRPLAAGSIAQVHRAVLTGGEDVVLKIRRPGIVEAVEADLRLLGHVAGLIESNYKEWQWCRPRALLQHFALSLRRELDLESECHHAERIALAFADNPDIEVPRVYWEWTGRRMNVQAYVEGIHGRDMAGLEAAGLDRKLLARRGANAVLKMALEDGFFHADPHPGNVFYLRDNRIALIDFGMVGRLTPARRGEVADLLYALAGREASKAADILLAWSGDNAVQREALEDDVEAFIDRFHGRPLERIDLGRLLGDLTALLRDHHLALAADLALLLKTAISLEGLGRMLNPDFDMVTEAVPFLRRTILARRAPGVLAKRAATALSEAMEVAVTLPGELRRLLQSARGAALPVKVEVSRLEQTAARLERSVSRLTIGIITAALIIGSSIVMTVSGGSGWFGPSFLGLVGLAAAIAGGLGLLISIWRGDRS
ncbi:MAG TPA: AarF/UbiB family protein [Burkholderiales bacterium]|nr:AarF/UbiB family protein [Burkholderiales bacterium]